MNHDLDQPPTTDSGSPVPTNTNPTPPRRRSGRVALPGGWLLGVLLVLARSASGQEALPVEYLSAHPELFLAHEQAWGQLGLDVAAHEASKTGDMLRIGSQTYTNGLGHHANGRLVVWLGGDFARFEAEVGVQPCANGSVIFRVLADGKTLFDSGTLRSSDAPKAVSVSVSGAQELVLEAGDNGDGIACDMANWANARLLRSRPAHAPTTADAVDIAPFAQVVVSDPQRTNGATADRLQEFRAEDIMLESELRPDADGSYVVKPDAGGIACPGLKWFGNRALREVRLRFADRTKMPAAEAVRIQGWFGESAWQGNWWPLAGETFIENDEIVVRLAAKSPTGGLLQTRKIRWLLPTQEKSVVVRDLKAFTRSRWERVSVVAEFENPPTDALGQVRVFSGRLLSCAGQSPTSSTSWNECRLDQPLALQLQFALPSFLKGDATVLQFQLPRGGIGVAIEDVLTHGCVYVPSRGLYVRLAQGPAAAPTLAEYRKSIAGRRTILDEVRALPDQTLAQAMARTHHDAQDEGPVMLSLSCDNTKCVVERNGEVRFPDAAIRNDDWFGSAGRLRVVCADGQRDRASRTLEGGWLPIPVMTVERDGVRYTERVWVAPTGADGEDPARLNRESVCVVETTIENPGEQATTAKLALAFRRAGASAAPGKLRSEGETRWSAKLGATQATVVLDETGSVTAANDAGTLSLSFSLPAKGRRHVVVYLGDAKVNTLPFAEATRLRAAVERYWQAVLAPATQIETPDELLNRVIRSSQVRCLIAARNEADGARVAPWIAAMSYGPLESEAHSVIRGMDFLGHHAFAQRGLDYFIHRYNTNGFLTTGYTTFGTAWHLWTVGEHYELTRDQAWLRRNAPELRRVGDWILRQTEKTKLRNADGEPLPEFGLMPPAVMADWNAYACHFMLNGYYYAALRDLGAALASTGEPRAPAYTRGAEELRQNIRRAYQWTQAQSPALPLRDGTWIPLYPSQVHSPGKLADFFPGDDVGRSWAYDVELGAHQLVPTGVFAADAPEVTRMLNHLEDVQFLGEGWFDYPAAANAKDWFNLGGFAKVQPYYCRNAEVYALRDDVRPFLRTYFNSLASLLNTEVLTLWEHFRHSGAWDKTHETGYFLHQTRVMLVEERGNDLWLAPLIPSDWLREGRTLEVRNAPTRFGPVSFRIATREAARQMAVDITPPTRNPPQRIAVRLRHPDGRAIASVTLNGTPHHNFDAKAGTIFFPPDAKPMALEVQFQ